MKNMIMTMIQLYCIYKNEMTELEVVTCDCDSEAEDVLIYKNENRRI